MRSPDSSGAWQPEPSPGSVASWLAVARRRWPIGVVTFALIVGLAAALVLLARPVWRAEASVRIGAVPGLGGVSVPQGGSPAGLFSLFQQMTGDPFANELELLSSRTVVEDVVRENALDVKLEAPRGWYRDSLLTRLASSGRQGIAAYEAEWLESGRVRVRRTAPSDSLMGEFQAGSEAALDGLLIVFRPHRSGMPRTVELSTIPFGEAVRQTSAKLAAQRKRREANLVRIAYSSPDPGVALRVVQSASDRYIALRTALQRRESGQTTDSLRVVAAATLDELRREEVALERFQRDAGLVTPEAQSDAFVERQTEVVGALERARVELARTDEVLVRLEGAPDPASAWVGLVAHPTFLANPTLGELLTTLMRLEQERIALRGRRTAEDGGVRVIDEQIALLDGSLRSLLRQYRAGVADGVQLLQEQRADLDATLQRVPADAIELRRRERALRQLSEVYLFTDQRLRQEALRNALSFATVQVIDPPAVLFKPVWPRKKVGLGIGVLLGLVFGMLGMAVAERADRSVRSTREIAELTSLPVLATLKPAVPERNEAAPAQARALLRPRDGYPPEGLVLVPVDGSGAARLLAGLLTGTSRAGNGGDGSQRRPKDSSVPTPPPEPDAGRSTQNGGSERDHSIAPQMIVHGILPGRPSDAAERGSSRGAPRSAAEGGVPAPGQPGSPVQDRHQPVSSASLAAAQAMPSQAPSDEEPRRHGSSRYRPTAGEEANPPVTVGPIVDRYSAALDLAETVAAGAEVLLVVRAGVTSRDALARAATLAREVGVTARGVVVVADGEGAGSA
jgi:uncharacterized protein involved in exopolysaccharide biosynthesis